MSKSERNEFKIGDRIIGKNHPCFVIAEIGINHNGSRDQLLRLVEAAAKAGADAVKLQYFTAERLVSPLLMPEICDFFRTVEITKEDARCALDLAREKGIVGFASVFDEKGLNTMLELGMPCVKIASGDVTNPPFLAHAAKKDLPILLSTGAASIEEIDAAVAVIRENGNPPLALLQCASLYPAPLDRINLSVIPFYRERYGVTAGFSDHTLGIEAAAAAVAAGARVYEKHFTLDSSDPRPDHALSLDPERFRAMVDLIRRTERMMGRVEGSKPLPEEAATREAGRKSLTAARDLPAGHVLTREDILVRRPSTGLPPADLDAVLGRALSSELKEGEALVKEVLSFEEDMPNDR